MRLFVAVPLGPAATRALDSPVAALSHAQWRPVAAHSRHLTLRFLGERPGEEAAALRRALGAALAGGGAFDVELRGLGVFPHRGRPLVLWAGCGPGAERLDALAHRVEGACRAAGLPPADRPFSPHLTLARRRDRNGGDAGVPALLHAWGDARWGVLRVSRVLLLCSELHGEGPRYTTVGEWVLAGRLERAIP